MDAVDLPHDRWEARIAERPELRREAHSVTHSRRGRIDDFTRRRCDGNPSRRGAQKRRLRHVKPGGHRIGWRDPLGEYPGGARSTPSGGDDHQQLRDQRIGRPRSRSGR